MRLIKSQVLLRKESLEKELINLRKRQKELEEILNSSITEKKEDRFFKSFQDMDLDIEVPSNLDFLEEPIIIEKVNKSKLVKTENITKVIKLSCKTISAAEQLFNKLINIEKTISKEVAINYLNGYIEYINPNNKYNDLKIFRDIKMS